MSDAKGERMSKPAVNPEPIMQLATAYWGSVVLLAANELGIFAALAHGHADAKVVAERLKLDQRATEMVLNACVGLGLLEKHDDAFHLTPSAAIFLVPNRPGYLGSALRWSRDQYDRWGRLIEAVTTGKPIDPQRHLGDNPQQTRTFVLAMHERAQGVARQLVGYLPLADSKSLLDVGGGPAAYASLLAERHPGLQVTVMDLPPIVAVARELVEARGLQDRVHFIAGDATRQEYGEQLYDAVMFNGVLHQMGETTIQRMLEWGHRALKPGGRLIVCDVMLDLARTHPVFSALFSIQMMLTSEAGGVFAAEECHRWMNALGMNEVEAVGLPPPLPYTLVLGKKPAD